MLAETHPPIFRGTQSAGGCRGAAGCGAILGAQGRLDEELKRFNNPNSEKTRKLFLDFLEVDVTKSWAWNQYDAAKVKEKLDTLIGKRGEAMHRSTTKRSGPPEPHLITKDELKKAIGFLRALVDATEKAL